MALNLIRICLCILYAFTLSAKDFGVQGEVFPIEETDLMESIKKKLESLSKEELEQIQQNVQKEIRQIFEKPNPVRNVSNAIAYKTFYFDPTIVVKEDIKDHEGKVVIKQGTIANPLQNCQMSTEWLFFDGDNKSHIDWAREQSGKWILTKGKPLELESLENREVYFDQFGNITNRLNIKHVPARVSQEGLRLKIEEISL